jgi:hypothetical protein
MMGSTRSSRLPVALGALVVLAGIAATFWALKRHDFSPVSQVGSANPSPAPASVAPSTSAVPDVVLMATSALLSCVAPQPPTAVPDGASASIEQMRAARKSVTDFDAATNVYTSCVDSTATRLAQQYRNVTSAGTMATVNSLGATLHNEAVEKDKAVAEQLNQQIRIYKAKHSS